MSKNAPILIIDDDAGSLELSKMAFAELNLENKIILFKDSLEFIEYIQIEQGETFFTLCDMNMPKMTGLELKKKIDENVTLRLKCIPFIFLSTSNASKTVIEAYSKCVHGDFVKPDEIKDLIEMFRSIVQYWSHSLHPNYISSYE